MKKKKTNINYAHVVDENDYYIKTLHMQNVKNSFLRLKHKQTFAIIHIIVMEGE